MQPEGRMKGSCIQINNKSLILDGIQARDQYHCESQLLLRLVRELEAFERISWFFYPRTSRLTLVCSRAGNEATRRSNVLLTCLLAIVFW